ncbi:uncharacterized protein LOC129981405 [Argiope bruennichi]|uniref:uncharacterized protein LOC129981405 n=1 Tax=Argiope bruennichi TaxID=94029 RepID=UPI0024948064|nr:uncharacterized protein LOC129981405 [Argiope bruennichi]
MEGLIPKSNERLSNVINRLKRQLGASEDILGTEDASEQLDLTDTESSSEWSSEEDKSLSKNFLMFENNSNLCWLNSSVSLLAHNKTLHNFANDISSQVSNIIIWYKNAISIYNDYSIGSAVEVRLKKAKDMLEEIQMTALEYLKPILKCTEGEPDSAFCSLLNLINENEQIKNLFLVEFSWIRNCAKCAVYRAKNNKKTIITLSKVRAFNPVSPVSLYKCPFCKSLDQEMEIKYKTLPQCLIFHFENGAGEGELESLDFELNDRKYKLSGLITLEKGRDSNINHFVTWIRDIVSDSWLERNDLNNDILSFSVVPPVINLEDLYIAMYEALDNKGTLVNASVDIANINGMDLDDTSSSCIPVINLSDEEEGVEFNKENQTKKVSNLPSMGGLFKHDKTSQDNREMSKQLDELFSDDISVTKNSLDIAVSKIEKLLAKNESLLQMDVFPKPVDTNSHHDDRNGFKNSTAENMKQSLHKDSIDILKEDENKSLDFSNSEIASFDKPVLENNIKTSKKKSGKPLVRTISSIEKLEMQTNTKEISFGKKDIPSVFAENLLGKDHNISSSKDLSIPFENEDNNKKADRPRENPVASQNSNVLMEESNNLKVKKPFNAVKECLQDVAESCARTSGLSTYPKKSRKKTGFKYDKLAGKKCKHIKNENFPENAVAGNLDNTPTSRVAEKSAETSTFPDLAIHNPFTQKQLQQSDIHLSALPDNKKPFAPIATSKDSDSCVLESKSVDNLESKTQCVNICSQNIGRKASFSDECIEEAESTTSKQIYISDDLQTVLNSPDEKSSVIFFESTAHSNLSKDLSKHANKFISEVFSEDEKNLISNSDIKHSKINANSLEETAPKLTENKHLPLHQVTVLNNKTATQPKAVLASSLKSNEQLNVQSLERNETTEECIREIEEKLDVFPQNQLRVNNSPSKMPFVHLTKMKDTEIANYISGKINFAKPMQIKSLEELTKTIVVKVEETCAKSIFKQKVEQTDSLKTKVRRVKSIYKSPRIVAQEMKIGTNVEKAKVEAISKEGKSSQEQLEDDISTKRKTRRRENVEKAKVKTTSKKGGNSQEQLENNISTEQKTTKRRRENVEKAKVEIVSKKRRNSQKQLENDIFAKPNTTKSRHTNVETVSTERKNSQEQLENDISTKRETSKRRRGNVEKAKVETVSKKRRNSQKQLENDIFPKPNTTKSRRASVEKTKVETASKKRRNFQKQLQNNIFAEPNTTKSRRANVGKTKVETVSIEKKNSQEQFLNDIFAKPNTTESILANVEKAKVETVSIEKKNSQEQFLNDIFAKPTTTKSILANVEKAKVETVSIEKKNSLEQLKNDIFEKPNVIKSGHENVEKAKVITVSIEKKNSQEQFLNDIFTKPNTTKSIIANVEKAKLETVSIEKKNSLEQLENNILAKPNVTKSRPENIEKAKVETVSVEKKNSQEQLKNDIFAKPNTTKSRCEILEVFPEVTKKALETQNFPERINRTLSVTEVHSDVSNIESQKTTKKELSDDINADNGAKVGNCIRQMCFPTSLINLSQVPQAASNAVLRDLDPQNECSSGSTNKNNLDPGHDAVENTEDKIQLHSDLFQSSNMHEHRTRNVGENTTKCDENKKSTSKCEHSNNMRISQNIECNANAFFAVMLQYLLFPADDEVEEDLEC